MKRKTLFIYILLSGSLAFCLASCGDENYTNPGTDQVAVTFVPQIEGQQGAAPKLHAESRAVDQTWSSGDQVGICMAADGVTLPWGSTFNRYQVSGSGTSVSLSPVSVDQTLFYPVDGSDVNFVAFSPYSAVSTNLVVSYNTFADQSTQAKMEAADFLYHKGTTAYNKTSTSAALAFGHKFSKIVINVTTSDDANAVTLSSLNMQITGTPGSVYFNLIEEHISNNPTATITPYHTSPDANIRVATAIVVPHAAKSGRTITFATDEGNFTYTFPGDDIAFESNKVYTLNFKMTQKGVELADATIGNWNSGTVNWTSKYMFELLNNNFAFTTAANTATTMTFNTNSGIDPTVVLSTSATDAGAGTPEADWLTGELTTSAKTGYTAYTYTFNVAENTDGFARQAYAHILNGTTSLAVVPVTQKGTYEYPANCYIVKAGSNSILIPVSRANEHAAWVNDDSAKIGDDDELVATVLWSTVAGLVTVEPVGSGVTGAVKVTTTADANTEGNALIAVKVGDVVKWSWHIWVTNYEPTPIGELGWMDRNLGATSNSKSTDLTERAKTHGLYYQWGRKDPFPSAQLTDATTAVEPTLYNGEGTSFTYSMSTSTLSALGAATLIKSTQSIAYWVKNPLTFTIASATNGSSQWGAQAGKELYDPCPEGYRVPKNGSWGTANLSYLWNDTYQGCDLFAYGGWYPLNGRRHPESGLLRNMDEGMCWSATSSRGLLFRSAAFNPQNTPSFASGIAVRCYKE